MDTTISIILEHYTSYEDLLQELYKRSSSYQSLEIYEVDEMERVKSAIKRAFDFSIY